MATYDRTREEERDAFYFARLLLEHREFLYFSEKDSKIYKDSQNKWRDLIEYVYGTQADCEQEYLKWVLED
jgi:hypothetical protein